MVAAPDEESSDEFKKMEATVLSWLVERPAVSCAVDMAMAGFEDDAAKAVTQAIRSLWDEMGEEEPAAVADGAGGGAGGGGGGAPGGGAVATAGAEEQPSAQAPEVGEPPPAKRPRKGPTGPARCVFVLVVGLRGSGKSTLCNILREVLGGTWLNYDEFASKQTDRSEKRVRQVFGGELRACITRSLAYSDRDRNMRLLLVDRDAPGRAQRSELLLELKRLSWRKRGGKVFLIEFTHAADTFGYGADGQLSKRCGEHHVALCAKRIEDRGAAHHTFWPTPKLRTSLQKAARGMEAISGEELAHFDGKISVDVALPPPDAALEVIGQLRTLGWLEQLRSDSELRPKVRVTWQAYRRAESLWREGAAAEAAVPQPEEEWLSQCRKAVEATRAEEKARAKAAEQEQQRVEQPPAEPEAALQAEPAQPAAEEAPRQPRQPPPPPPPPPQPQPQPQEEEQRLAGLAAAGAAPEEAEAAERARAERSAAAAKETALPAAEEAQTQPPCWRLEIPQILRVIAQPGLLPQELKPVAQAYLELLPKDLEPERTLAAQEALEALQGEDFVVRMKEIIIVERKFCCASISLPTILPCANKVPHVVMGLADGVSARFRAELLEAIEAGEAKEKFPGEQVVRVPMATGRQLTGKLVL